MVSTQPHYFNFPQFPSPPFHPFNPPPPPSHSFAPPPPPSHRPPPPPSHPFSPPPSPFHPIFPPPHVLPPPVPVPPSPSPNNHPIVIVVVFVSLGGLVLLSLLAFALCCSIKKSKKTTTTQETEIIHVDEHKELKETIVTDPFGKQAVVLSIEDDVHIEEEIIKNEKAGHNLHAESDQGNSKSKKTQKADIIHVDEHKKIKENIVSGPFGQQAVVISIEDDVHIEEEIIKNEEKVGQSLHAESDQGNSNSKQKKSHEMDIIHADEHKEIKEKIVTGLFGKQVVLSIEDDFDMEEEKIKNEEKFGHNLHATSTADQDNSKSIDVGTTSSDHEHQQQQLIENKP